VHELDFAQSSPPPPPPPPLHQVKTVPWKIAFIVARLNGGSHVFARRLAAHNTALL
jgi:hypothetical protein